MIKGIIQKIIDLNRDKSIKANSIQTNRLNELLRDDIELSAIPDAFQLLLSSDEKIKFQSAEVLNHVMSTLNSSQLIKLDKIFRERTSYDWNYDWRNKEPEELFHPLMSREENIAILGLSSFHPNGYFREKAVRALSNMETGDKIPYLLIRINDWVSQVRNISRKQLLIYLTPEYAMSFVKNLPLVLRLEECLRNEHMDIIDAVVSMLSSDKCLKELISGLQSADPKVRLCCYKIILQRRILDNKSIISYVIKDKNPYNRLFVLRNIQGNIASDEFTDISQLLLKDKLSQIRIIALELLYKFNPEEAIDTLEKSLFDRNQSVRELSRYLLSKHKKYDFPTIYRDAIEKNEQLYSSICGLGETGNRKDSKIIAEFLKVDTIQIVKASISALARLDIDGYKEEIIITLNDRRVGISKVARRVLYKEIDAIDADAIYNIFKQTTYDHAKINSSILLCSLSKWDAIRYIIEFCADENDSISIIGGCAFESWKQRYNQSFTTPTKNQIDKIRKSLMDFGKFIKDSDRDFIEFTIRDFIK
ncbi:hypothetical protein KQI86_07475 [Clostridium sp. MSJ-11]|uniref:HEAT repeat domain-containing protein n=1 Tax=Clostridium mobile TaxID=2841512 RepID=A0ABS6EHI9_9CLOT|nr:hypothetical protein [Clostridium mobile]MBU5484166.1 hypothetical protein [Clostridium mobile]